MNEIMQVVGGLLTLALVFIISCIVFGAALSIFG